MKKFLLWFLVIATALDLGISYFVFKKYSTAGYSYKVLEVNPIVRWLIGQVGLEMALLVILPIVLSVFFFFIWKFWIERFKWLYIGLCSVKLAVLIIWGVVLFSTMSV